MIEEQNQKDDLPKDKYKIKIPILIANLKLVQGFTAVLAKDPADERTRSSYMKLRETMQALNRIHDYPDTSVIDLPASRPEPADSTEGGVEPIEGGVKIRVSVSIPDQSDGRTSHGKVLCVMPIRTVYRVVVKRGTDMHPLFEAYLGMKFENKVAQG